jgi:hypothetical protein
MELRIQDITSWSLDNYASYFGPFTSREMVEPFINPNLNLLPRTIVIAVDQRR